MHLAKKQYSQTRFGKIHVMYISRKNYLPPNIVFYSVSIGLNMCFGFSKEPSQRDGSFEYPQHMFWLICLFV